MSFDGIAKPSQILSHSDPMGAYASAYAATTRLNQKPKIKSVKKDQSVEGVNKHLKQYAQEDEESDEEQLSEEELAQQLLFAKMKELMHLSLENGTEYHLVINPLTQQVELRERHTEKVIMSLTPEELQEVSSKVKRYAGLITDHNA